MNREWQRVGIDEERRKRRKSEGKGPNNLVTFRYQRYRNEQGLSLVLKELNFLCAKHALHSNPTT